MNIQIVNDFPESNLDLFKDFSDNINDRFLTSFPDFIQSFVYLFSMGNICVLFTKKLLDTTIW